MQILQYLDDKSTNRKVISAFRGVGKSTLASMLLLHRLFVNPDEKCLVVSASLSRSEALTAWMLKTISEVPWLRHLQPNSHDGRYSRLAFDVGTCQHIDHSPSVKASSVTGMVTGSRASYVLLDDVETPISSATQHQREKLRNILNEFEAILLPVPHASITYLGTPHTTTDSIYFALKRELNYDMRIWPGRIPESDAAYNGCLSGHILKRMPHDAGKPSDTRFPEHELVQRELSMSPAQWQMQFMINCTLSDRDRYPLRCGDCLVTTLDKYLPEVVTYEKGKHLSLEDLPCVGMVHDSRWYRPLQQEGTVDADDVPTVMALDVSAGGSDEFAWAVVKAWGGNFYLVESGGHLGGMNEDFAMKLATIAKKYSVKEIAIETNFGGLEVWAAVLKAPLRKVGAECRLEPIRSNQQKELRIIETLAPILQTHRFVIDRRVIEKDAEIVKNAKDDKGVSYSAFYQMTRLTYDRGSLLHDDRLDAIAMAVSRLHESAAQDQKVQAALRAVELLNAEFEDETGYALMSLDRQALGMSLEQARMSEVRGGSGGGSWI